MLSPVGLCTFWNESHEDELKVGMRYDEALNLFGQTILDGRCRVRETESVVRLVGELSEPLFHSCIGILKAKIEYCSLTHVVVPEKLSYAYSQSPWQAPSMTCRSWERQQVCALPRVEDPLKTQSASTMGPSSSS